MSSDPRIFEDDIAKMSALFTAQQRACETGGVMSTQMAGPMFESISTQQFGHVPSWPDSHLFTLADGEGTHLRRAVDERARLMLNQALSEYDGRQMTPQQAYGVLAALAELRKLANALLRKDS